MTEQEELKLFKKYLFIRKGKVNNTGRLSCRDIPKEDYLKFEEIFGVTGKAYHRNKGYMLISKSNNTPIAHLFKTKDKVNYTCSNSQRLLFSKYDLPHITNIDDFIVEEVITCKRPKRKLYSSKNRNFKLEKF